MRNYIFTLSLLIVTSVLKSQELPVGFISLFETDFSTTTLHKDFLLSPAAMVKINKGIMSVTEKADSVPVFMPPATLIVNNNIFGDFIAEIRINTSTIQSDSVSGVYLITGLRDSLNYYFVRLNGYGASFCRMYKGKQSIISFDSTFILSQNIWLTLRVERDILSRTFVVISGGKKLVCSDANLVMGYFGIGVKNKKLLIDKIIIWAPTSIAYPAPLFR